MHNFKKIHSFCSIELNLTLLCSLNAKCTKRAKFMSVSWSTACSHWFPCRKHALSNFQLKQNEMICLCMLEVYFSLAIFQFAEMTTNFRIKISKLCIKNEISAVIKIFKLLYILRKGPIDTCSSKDWKFEHSITFQAWTAV